MKEGGKGEEGEGGEEAGGAAGTDPGFLIVPGSIRPHKNRPHCGADKDDEEEGEDQKRGLHPDEETDEREKAAGEKCGEGEGFIFRRK